MKTIYDLKVKNILNEDIFLSKYKNKVILIVNVASKCSFTPQYDELQKLFLKYKDEGLVILGFPCSQFLFQEFSDNKKIIIFCYTRYNVTFDIFSKIDVKGKNKNPLYNYLIENDPFNKNINVKWNFEKFLINKKGEVVERFLSKVPPSKIEKKIIFLLKE